MIHGWQCLVWDEVRTALSDFARRSTSFLLCVCVFPCPLPARPRWIKTFPGLCLSGITPSATVVRRLPAAPASPVPTGFPVRPRRKAAGSSSAIWLRAVACREKRPSPSGTYEYGVTQVLPTVRTVMCLGGAEGVFRADRSFLTRFSDLFLGFGLSLRMSLPRRHPAC